jgi:penicillin-binding protein 1A
MEPDGTVKAIVGGTDYAKSQYNRAVTARRQMGSAFKPIVYLAALEAGLSPETVIDSGPLDYNGWSPENASGKYYGPVTMREGLANSLNTVAARLAIHVGPQAVVNTAYRLGISTQIDPVPSIALGTPEISLLELTAAYAPFSNGGAGVIAHVISRIETADGEVLYDHIPAGPGQVVAPDKLGMMNAMLSYALEAGTGKNAQLPGWQIAGKTGTSQEYRDAVFVGYSARMVTGIWLGNDDSTPTQRVGGGSFPAQLWTQFMAKAHEGLAPADLPGQYIPQQVQQAEQPQRQRRNIGDFLRDLFGG